LRDYWQVLFVDEDDDYDVYTSEDRKELLFQIMTHLALGGPLNQVLLRSHCSLAHNRGSMMTSLRHIWIQQSICTKSLSGMHSCSS
jgi:hypothetical protein